MAGKPNKLKIFLSSSNELKEERDQFRLFISQLNDKFVDKGIYLEVVQWEHFLDAISNTRLQDEYNKALSESDIALCIYFTKLGQFSQEEFKTAYTKFKATGKPRIWTYFKDAPISIGAITDEIRTLLDFKNKIRRLGHFQTNYSSTADLHNKFRDQLDRLYPAFVTPFELQSEHTEIISQETSIPSYEGKAPVKPVGKAERLHLVSQMPSLVEENRKLKEEINTNFYTEQKIRELVAKAEGLNTVGDAVKTLLIFETTTQHTWLALASQNIYLLLDSESTRVANRLIQLIFEKTKTLPLKTENSTKSNGSVVVKFAARDSWWFYSRKLFPTSEALTESVQNLIN